MTNEMTVSYQYTKQDIINFVLDSYSFEKIRCSLFLIMNLTAFTIGLVFLCLKNYPLCVLFIGFSLIAFPLILFLSFITASNSLKIITNVVCTLKDDGISFISNLGDNLIPYKDVHDVKVTEELIFLYISKGSALMIPKRAFKNKEKAIDFAAALMERFKRATTPAV